MADEPISGLPETTSVTGNEFIPIVQSGVTKKIKQSNLVPNQASFSTTVLFDSNITMVAGVIYLEKNTNASNRSLTIPSATGNTGKFIFVAKQFNNGYTINCSGGGISSTLTRSNDSVLYVCDGTSWQPHLNISNELLLSLTTKEPTITAGTTSQYWRGDKTWQTFPTISTPNLDEVTDVGNTTNNTLIFPIAKADSSAGFKIQSNAGTDIAIGGAGGGAGWTFYGGVIFDTLTANTLTFLNTSKQLITATGALLGTWFQTLTAKSTPIGADTIIVNDSASSFETKKTTLTELWNNYLRAFVFSATLTTNRVPRANSGVLADSLIEVDAFAGVYLKRLSTTFGSGLYTEDRNGNFNAGIGRALGSALIYARLHSTTEVSNLMNLVDTTGLSIIDVKDGYTIIQGRNTFAITLGIRRSGDTGSNCYFNFYNNRTIAIDDSGSDAVNDTSSIFTMRSTSKGFLKPRLTSAQIASISTPAQGLHLFNTDLRSDVIIPTTSGNPIRVSGTMFTQTANAQVQNTVTETSLVGTGVGSNTIKANSSGIGTTYRLSMCGFISNTGTPFAQVKVKIGSVTVFDTTSTGMFGITSNQPFKVNAVFTVRTLGASGTVIGQGEFEYATSASTQYQIMFQANTATSTIDTTVDQTVDITFTWGTANDSNSINSTNFTLERL